MKLFDLLESAKKTGDIIINNKYKLGVIYSTRYDCFVWCDKDGKAIESTQDYTGYKRVILSLKLLERDDWYLDPINKIPNKPKVYLTSNGLVIDKEDFCNIIKSDGLGSCSMIEINKREGTIINKQIPIF